MTVNNNNDFWTDLINVCTGLVTVGYVGIAVGKFMRGERMSLNDVAPLVISGLTHVATRY